MKGSRFRHADSPLPTATASSRNKKVLKPAKQYSGIGSMKLIPLTDNASSGVFTHNLLVPYLFFCALPPLFILLIARLKPVAMIHVSKLFNNPTEQTQKRSSCTTREMSTLLRPRQVTTALS